MKKHGKKMKQIIPAAFIFLFLSLHATAQNIDSAIEKYGNDYGQERAYLHFDKSTYAAGETIWYKVYLMNGIFPADESKTMYIDWTDDKETCSRIVWYRLFMLLLPGSLIFLPNIPQNTFT